MNDPCIRRILRQTELSQYIFDEHSKVVEELKLPVAKARIDIAVINGHLHGYEIKSASDTLQRLPNQIIAYTKVFDYLTIVTEKKYHERILSIIPAWVGVYVCSKKNGKDVLQLIKEPLLNLNKESFYIAKLLWRDELIDVLNVRNIPFNKKHRNWLLCEILVCNINVSELSNIVRQKLKDRQDWKFKEDYAVM